MKRAVVPVAIVAGLLSLGLLAADVLAQSYYTPPTPRPTPTPPAPTPVQPLRQMAPFPIVRIVGTATRRGARIRILSVRAPASATIVVRCRRKGCARRSRARGRGMRRAVRFRRFERGLRAGTILEVAVGRADVLGKFTRFRIRARRRPLRTDLCLAPGATTGTACPE